MVERVVADFAMPLRRTDARLIHRLAEHLGHRPIVRPSGRHIQSRTFAAHDRRENSQPGGLLTNGNFLFVAQADSEQAVSLQIAMEVGCRAEH